MAPPIIQEAPWRPHVKESIDRLIRALVTRQKERAISPKYHDVIILIRNVRAELIKEPPLVEIMPSLPTVILGDIRGDCHDLARAYMACMTRPSLRLAHLTHQFVCLGNYVGDGNYSVHVLMLLFAMKIRCPRSVILLRGNHEMRSVDASNRFKAELHHRFSSEQAEDLFEQFNDVFDNLPLACLIGGRILCVHGGISPSLTSLEDIRNIPKPLKHPNDHFLACDLLWADPMLGLKGFMPNSARGRSVYFGEDVLEATMRRLGVAGMVRGHEIIYKGTSVFGDSRLITVTTATDLNDRNYGAVIDVKPNCSMGHVLLLPDPFRTRDEADYTKYDHRPNHAEYKGANEIQQPLLLAVEDHSNREVVVSSIPSAENETHGGRGEFIIVLNES